MNTIKIDRKVQPQANGIGHIPFHFPETFALKNGREAFVYKDPSCEVFRIEFQFDAGSAHAKRKLEAAFTNKLITSGTSDMTEKQISERLDYFGAYFEKHLGKDEASFSIYSMKKYGKEVLNVVAEVLSDPIFPQEEIDTLRNIRRQKFLVNLEKVGFLARREFSSRLFGVDHAYGRTTKLEDFDQVNREALLKFHAENYQHAPLIMVSGNVDDSLLDFISEKFSNYGSISNGRAVNFNTSGDATGRYVLEKKDAVQSALRIGRKMFNRKHEDFPEMQVLNTVLGGYFGSRLMSNIREDKGYTYGIGSGIASMLHNGYFFISTEVGVNNTQDAEKEIWKEVDALKEKLVSEDELNLVKNYLLGQILKSTDGVFSKMSRFRTLHLFNQKEEDFQRMIEGIRNASAERLRDLANQWFIEDEMLTIIAGKERS